MAIPTDRASFIEFCLRSLGKPVINIDVDPTQIDDKVDLALSYWWDYYYDGTEVMYYKHQITDEDKVNQYITLPDNIIGAVRIFSLGDPSISSDALFNIRYQIALNDLYNLTSTSLVPYYMAMEHLSLITQLVVGQQPIRYNRHTNLLYVDMQWQTINTGTFLLIEAYQVIDPETYADVWKDRWLFKYCTAQIKQAWGNNLKKFSGVQMVGGVTLNGQQIYDEADREIKELERQMQEEMILPSRDFYG